jgi:threonine dehydrogenase-like Zn-dependent dehydrogenase
MVFLKELELLGTAAYTDEFDICIDLFAKKKISLKRYISDTVGFEGVQGAFERLTSGDTSDIKILIDPLK